MNLESVANKLAMEVAALEQKRVELTENFSFGSFKKILAMIGILLVTALVALTQAKVGSSLQSLLSVLVSLLFLGFFVYMGLGYKSLTSALDKGFKPILSAYHSKQLPLLFSALFPEWNTRGSITLDQRDFMDNLFLTETIYKSFMVLGGFENTINGKNTKIARVRILKDGDEQDIVVFNGIYLRIELPLEASSPLIVKPNGTWGETYEKLNSGDPAFSAYCALFGDIESDLSLLTAPVKQKLMQAAVIPNRKVYASFTGKFFQLGIHNQSNLVPWKDAERSLTDFNRCSEIIRELEIIGGLINDVQGIGNR